MNVKELNHIYTNVTKQELLKLHELVKNNKSGAVVEIGSYFGASTLAMATALKKGEYLYAIDIWQPATDLRPNPQTINRAHVKNQWITESTSIFDVFERNIQDYKNKIIPLIDYSIDAISFFTINDIGIDVLFIDGNHSVNAVTQDFELYFPQMNSNGIIIFHDYAWPSVRSVIDECVMDKTYNHENLPNMWWGTKSK